MHSKHTQSLTLVLTLLVATTLAPVALSTGAVAQTQTQQTVTVTGDVAIENESAAGDRITITPLTQQFQQAGQQAQTTVSGGSYSASGVANAPLYFVRLQHDGAAHYRLVSDPSGVDFRLGASLSARVVTDEGQPVANRTLFVLSSLGPPVQQVTTDENGTFTAGPLRSNATYRVSARVKGAPYRWTVATNSTEPARLVVRDPTRNESVLTATGGNPASHVIQPQSNPAGSTTVVETLTLRNTGDRPFAGGVTVNLPANATDVEARVGNQTMPTRRVDGGVQVNASLAAGTTQRLAVRYTVSGDRLAKPLAHDTEKVAVVLQGANVSQVETSANLAPGDSPVPLLTNDDPLSAGDEISVALPDQSGSSMSTGGQSSGGSDAVEDAGAGTGDGDGTDAPDLPSAALLGALVVTVVAGIGAYRFL